MLHSAVSTKPVKKGDLLVTSVRARVVGDRAATGLVAVYAESTDPGAGSVGGSILPTGEVKTYRRSVESPGDFPAGRFRVAVHWPRSRKRWKSIPSPSYRTPPARRPRR